MKPFSAPMRKPLKLTIALILLAIIMVVGQSNYVTIRASQNQPHSPQQKTPTAVPVAKLLFRESELAGQYYFGDGLGVNCDLNLKSNYRFTFKWTGCMGEYDSNQGTWMLNGDVLTLKPEKPYQQQGFQGMNIRLIPAKWGLRHLLIDENEMPGFCATASKSDPPSEEYVHSHDYVKVEAVKPKASSKGKLLIPERFREFYEKGPVEAKVVRLDKQGNVVLNKSAIDRIKPKMLMAITEFEGINVEVLSVSQHGCIAKPFYFWNSERRVKIGDQFTTGIAWFHPRGTGFQRFAAPPDAPPRRPR